MLDHADESLDVRLWLYKFTYSKRKNRNTKKIENEFFFTEPTDLANI